uniref:Uncharacterized protein n=1 Tax=Cryptomonas curvata TaxID=233186 RepID=A0A7S0QGY8_9CRYP|mmetsp:Transcript_22700/g.47671  ORF Transcript_22700/g.47671 Transcript_22700/m.47671 type:complete len:120 (+) Transcript_22700:3-362(+)
MMQRLSYLASLFYWEKDSGRISKQTTETICQPDPAHSVTRALGLLWRSSNELTMKLAACSMEQGALPKWQTSWKPYDEVSSASCDSAGSFWDTAYTPGSLPSHWPLAPQAAPAPPPAKR